MLEFVECYFEICDDLKEVNKWKKEILVENVYLKEMIMEMMWVEKMNKIEYGVMEVIFKISKCIKLFNVS